MKKGCGIIGDHRRDARDKVIPEKLTLLLSTGQEQVEFEIEIKCIIYISTSKMKYLDKI